MIKIDFYLDGFKIKGHSYYSSFGTDIVCSAISAIVLGSINWFDKNDVIFFESNKKDGYLFFKVKLNSKNKIGLSLIFHQIKSVSNEYKKNVLLTNFELKIDKEKKSE